MCEGIENALNLIVSTAERSSNMKKELKQTIFDSISTLRDLCVQLETSRDCKPQTIYDLEGRVASMKADLEASRGFMVKVHRETFSSATQEPARVTAKALNPPGGGGRKLFSEVLANGCNAKRFTMSVTSKDNQTSEIISTQQQSKWELMRSRLPGTEKS